MTLLRAGALAGAAAVAQLALAGAQEKPAPYAPKQSDRPAAVSGDEPG